MGEFSMWGAQPKKNRLLEAINAARGGLRGLGDFRPQDVGGTPPFVGESIPGEPEEGPPSRLANVLAQVQPQSGDSLQSKVTYQGDVGQPAPPGLGWRTGDEEREILPRVPTRLETLEDRRYMMEHPQKSLKRRLLEAAIPAAGIGLAAIFGGSEGASGAAQGVEESIQRQAALGERQRGQLLAEIEAERNRQERMAEHQLSLEAAKARADELNQYHTGTLEARRAADEARNERELLKVGIARQRAQTYQDSIDSLRQFRTARTSLDRDRLALQAEDLQRRITADENLDERSRFGLSQQLSIAMQNLGQRRTEEEGRMTRFREGEAGKTARVQLTQAEINKRAASSGKSAASVQKSFRAAEEAAKRLPGWQDMEPEQQSQTLDTLFGTFLANEPPAIKAAEGKSTFFGLGSNKPVTAVTRQPVTAPPATQQAGPAAKIHVRRKSDGQLGWMSPEGFNAHSDRYEQVP